MHLNEYYESLISKFESFKLYQLVLLKTLKLYLKKRTKRNIHKEERMINMAYYFMVESKKSQYQALDITKSKYFLKSSRYSKKGACSLKEIDDFTMMFDNEEELRNSLLQEGILPENLKEKPLCTRLLRNEKYTKVMYDFLYQKDLEFIYDPQRLIKYILNRYLQKDYLFIYKLASHYSNYRECSTTANEIRNYANNSIRYNVHDKHLDDIDRNGDIPVKRMTKLLIYKHYEDRITGKTFFTNEINYANLHNLIAFINNYNCKNNEYKNKIEQTLPKTPKVNPKTKKKRKEIEGQICLFED